MVTCPLRRNCTSRGFVWIATYLNEIRSAKIWLDERQGVFNCRIGLLRPIAKNPFFSLGNTKNWKYFIWADVLREKESDIKMVHIFCHLRKIKKIGLICDMFGIFNLSLLLATTIFIVGFSLLPISLLIFHCWHFHCWHFSLLAFSLLHFHCQIFIVRIFIVKFSLLPFSLSTFHCQIFIVKFSLLNFHCWIFIVKFSLLPFSLSNFHCWIFSLLNFHCWNFFHCLIFPFKNEEQVCNPGPRTGFSDDMFSKVAKIIIICSYT